MARPHSEGLEYFEHDVDASNDEKIESMEAIYGAAGYAFYFKMAERIYRAGGKLSVSDAEMRQILARKCLCSSEEWMKMLATALKIGLFDAKIYETNFVLTSNGIQKRCRKVFDKREKMAEKYRNRVSAAETYPETPPVEESRVEESRVKKKRAQKLVGVIDAGNLMPAKPDPDNVAATLATAAKANEFLFLEDGTYPHLSVPEISELWEVWLTFRRKNRFDNSPRALKIALNKLQEWPVEKAIEAMKQTVERSYRGVFEPKDGSYGKNGVSGGHPKPFESAQQRKDRRLREVMARLGKQAEGDRGVDHPALHLGAEGIAG